MAHFHFVTNGTYDAPIDPVWKITDLKAPTLMRLESSGDLVGSGQWDLKPDGGRTAVSYTWDVTLTKPLFSAITRLPFVRGLLTRNHEIVMSRGFERLRTLLSNEARPSGVS